MKKEEDFVFIESANMDFEVWQEVATGHLYNVPFEIVRDFKNATIKRIDDGVFWEMIEFLDWQNTSIPQCRFKLTLFDNNLIGDLKGFIDEKQNTIKEIYSNSVIKHQICGDDAWDDISAEFVARGCDYFHNCNFEEIRRMAEENDYRENFKYIFNN